VEEILKKIVSEFQRRRIRCLTRRCSASGGDEELKEDEDEEESG
jgi:hypothetical protein